MLFYNKMIGDMERYWDAWSEEDRVKIFESIPSFPRAKQGKMYKVIVYKIKEIFKKSPKLYESIPLSNYCKEMKIGGIEYTSKPFESDFQKEYSRIHSKIHTDPSYDSEILYRILDEECYDERTFLSLISKFEFLLRNGNTKIKQNERKILDLILNDIIPFKLHGIELYNAFIINTGETQQEMYLSLLYLIYINLLRDISVYNAMDLVQPFALTIYLIYNYLKLPCDEIKSDCLFIEAIRVYGFSPIADKVMERIESLVSKDMYYFVYLQWLGEIPVVKEIFSKYDEETILRKGIYNKAVPPVSGVIKNAICFGDNIPDEQLKELSQKVNFIISKNIIDDFTQSSKISYTIDESLLANIKSNYDNISFSFLKSLNGQDVLLIRYLNEYFIAFTKDTDKDMVYGISVEAYENGSRHMLEIDCYDENQYKFIATI